MTLRVLATTAAMIGFLGLCLLAEGSFSADWSAEITFDPNGSLVSDMESAAEFSYETGPVLWRSYSNVQLTVGYLWQEFGVAGHLGAFGVQGDVLFGPSTADFLYAQAIVDLRLAGLEIGVYAACVGAAVLGGPADGIALRVAGSLAGLEVISITEMGARIEDEDFDGIDIVHASTGSSRHYATDPIVPGRGFTGEKLSVNGLSFGCVGNVEATLYLTCDGFDFVSFELADVALGISWLDFDLEVTYQVEAKSVALTPDVVVADGLVCFTPYFAMDFGASPWQIDGFELGGLAFRCTWNGVTIRDLTVFDPWRFVITTEDYGTRIETLEDAIDDGHEYYGQYWELLSIEIDLDGCCGGTNRLLVNTYFGDASGVFGWGMSYVEACAGVTRDIELSGSMTVTAAGLDAVEVGVKLHW